MYRQEMLLKDFTTINQILFTLFSYKEFTNMNVPKPKVKLK